MNSLYLFQIHITCAIKLAEWSEIYYYSEMTDTSIFFLHYVTRHWNREQYTTVSIPKIHEKDHRVLCANKESGNYDEFMKLQAT